MPKRPDPIARLIAAYSDNNPVPPCPALQPRVGASTMHGDLKNTISWNFDVVGTLPIVADWFLLLGRLGIQSSKNSDLFAGTGAAGALRNPAPSKNLASYKYGVGAEYDFTKNIGVRGEFERYRISDSISGKLNVNAVTASLLYRF